MITPPPSQFLTEIDCNSQLCWNGQDYVSKSHFLSHNLPVPPAFNLWIGQYTCILLSEKFESVTCIENLTILNNITFRARRRSSLTPHLNSTQFVDSRYWIRYFSLQDSLQPIIDVKKRGKRQDISLLSTKLNVLQCVCVNKLGTWNY